MSCKRDLMYSVTIGGVSKITENVSLLRAYVDLTVRKFWKFYPVSDNNWGLVWL